MGGRLSERSGGEGITTLAKKNLDVTGTFGRSCVGLARGGDRRGEEGGQKESDGEGSLRQVTGLLDFENV